MAALPSSEAAAATSAPDRGAAAAAAASLDLASLELGWSSRTIAWSEEDSD